MATVASYKSKEESQRTRERKSTVVDRELDKIMKLEGGLTSVTVLATARPPKHPLHKYFEWDDSVAGEKYRLAQAYALIQSSKFVVLLKEQEKGPEAATLSGTVRRLVSTFRGEPFKMRNEALEVADERAVMIERKMGELRAWCRSVIDIEECQPLRKLIEKQLGNSN